MDVLVLVWKIKIFICEQKLKDQIVIPCTGQLKLKTSVDNFQYSFFEACVTVGGLYIYVVLRNHQ